MQRVTIILAVVASAANALPAATMDAAAFVPGAVAIDAACHAALSFDAFAASSAPGTTTTMASAWAGTIANQAPVATPNDIRTSVGRACDLGPQAEDPDGDGVRYVILASPAHGALVEEDECWSYHPDPGFTGNDTFELCADDGADCAQVMVITVAVCTPRRIVIDLYSTASSVYIVHEESAASASLLPATFSDLDTAGSNTFSIHCDNAG
jgi:hypothetical protein